MGSYQLAPPNSRNSCIILHTTNKLRSIQQFVRAVLRRYSAFGGDGTEVSEFEAKTFSSSFGTPWSVGSASAATGGPLKSLRPRIKYHDIEMAAKLHRCKFSVR